MTKSKDRIVSSGSQTSFTYQCHQTSVTGLITSVTSKSSTRLPASLPVWFLSKYQIICKISRGKVDRGKRAGVSGFTFKYSKFQYLTDKMYVLYKHLPRFHSKTNNYTSHRWEWEETEKWMKSDYDQNLLTTLWKHHHEVCYMYNIFYYYTQYILIKKWKRKTCEKGDHTKRWVGRLINEIQKN